MTERCSQEKLISSSEASLHQSQHDIRSVKPLTQEEKTFLLHAERGDCATVKSLIEQHASNPQVLNINCVDSLNRSALIAAIENENIELLKLLLEFKIQVKDGLLHAIKEEYVEAVELLLQWEEEHHVAGEPYSWESVEPSAATFTPDITPLILAAHRNHYEIIKILLDRGASLPIPHDVKCGCDECVASSNSDSLRHSQARINAYRALTSPSLIALSSTDPLLTAFQLSGELMRLSRMETEFGAEYKVLRQQCQEFATALLDHTRTSNELEILLNYNPWDLDSWESGERQTLGRLKLAIKYQQKQFVAHPNVQQLLGAIWYEGLPGFRRKTLIGQAIQVARLGVMFPVYCTIYMLAPNSETGKFMKKPFVKFICHSSSYMVFLSLLGLASQRAEYVLLEWIGTPWSLSVLDTWKQRERGALPGFIEFCVIVYIISLIWAEIRSLWSGGVMEYLGDLWNIVDFVTTSFYLSWIGLRISSWYIVQRDAARGLDPWYTRERWEPYDPMLLSEGVFAAGMIFSFLKLVHIFSINPHLGPLQVSLGRMILDIIKFFFIYSLVLFAFGCGLNQLLWYYADLEKNKCYHLPNGLPDFDTQEKACSTWRRYANLFETSQSLFWASFGLVDLMTFDLTGIKSFTRFWALLTFGSYSVINVIVLLNMLIAMMSNSYQIISERADVEWKFARTNLWMSYFEDGDTVPAPFNIIPTAKHIKCWLSKLCGKRPTGSIINKSREKARALHESVTRVLIRRYVTSEQRSRDTTGISEDDVMEIRQDISTLKYDIIDILHRNGMKTPRLDSIETAVCGKKGKVMERRLLKDFQIGIVEGILKDVIEGDGKPKDLFDHLAKAIGKRGSPSRKTIKKDWNTLVRTSQHGDPIGKTTEARRQSLRHHIVQNANTKELDVDKIIEYNPLLTKETAKTRVAYAKFMRGKLKTDINVESKRRPQSVKREDSTSSTNTVLSVAEKEGEPKKEEVTIAETKEKVDKTETKKETTSSNVGDIADTTTDTEESDAKFLKSSVKAKKSLKNDAKEVKIDIEEDCDRIAKASCDDPPAKKIKVDVVNEKPKQKSIKVRIAVAPAPMRSHDKGKSIVSGKVISGWL